MGQAVGGQHDDRLRGRDLGALSGMRSSELLELEVGCRTPARTVAGGGCRFRLSGKAIKNKRFGGAPDEWVVVEQVDRAIALAERLVGRPRGAVGLRHVSDVFWLPSFGRAPARAARARSSGVARPDISSPEMRDFTAGRE
ncbi:MULTISPECIES: hypothetical protein [unclassified Streptomyces]|uniref:hypothetical protein n=1 Tax=unclassified Streptomyces TaxID=2593676 RepID=UPI0038030007